MSTQNEDWNDDDDEEDVFNVAISQRTEELYHIPNHTLGDDGVIEALALPMRDLWSSRTWFRPFLWTTKLRC